MSDTPTTLAEQVTALIGASGAEFSRFQAHETASVTVKFTYPAGDVITGTGATTHDAVQHLASKLPAAGGAP